MLMLMLSILCTKTGAVHCGDFMHACIVPSSDPREHGRWNNEILRLQEELANCNLNNMGLSKTLVDFLLYLHIFSDCLYQPTPRFEE